MQRKTINWLLFIFLGTLGVRLIVAYSSPNFTYDSYFHMRQVQNIIQNGFPLFQDPLSYGGRELLFLPFFHYLMAIIGSFFSLDVVAKVVPNIFLSTLPITTFLIANKITKNEPASLFTAFIAGFLPILFTPNEFTPNTLFIPLCFFTIYGFLTVKDKKKSNWYIPSFLVLCLTSPAAFLLIIGFGIYLLLSVIERKRTNQAELELIIFSVFFYIWIQFLFFKNVLLEEGVAFIWQNIPSKIIQQYFPGFSIGGALLAVSIIPFVAGVFVVYRSLFTLKNERSFLLISFAISTTILTWLKLLPFHLSLSFFSVILAILFASFYKDTMSYITKTKLTEYKKWFSVTLFILLVVTIVPPAISAAKNQQIPTTEEISAFVWMKTNTPQSVVVSSLEEGNLVTYFSERKNLMDNHFSRISDVDNRFTAIRNIYTTSFETAAIDAFNEYNISYVVLTPHARKKFDVARLQYHSPKCFKRVYDKSEIKIYQIGCTIQ